MNRKTLKKQLEELSWYELMTSQPLVDMYIEHIKNEPLPYDSEDENAEKEGMIEDFREIISGRGKAILKTLLSSIHVNESFGDRIQEFARTFAQSENPKDYLYWMQMLVSYTVDIIMMLTSLDKDNVDTKEEKDTLPSDKMSLSVALRTLKSEKYWTPNVAKAFADVGIMSREELTPARFVSLMTKNNMKDKKTGKKVVGIWGERFIKDYDGFKKLYSDGTFKKEKVLRRVNSWTMKKLLQALAYNGIVLDLKVE